MKTSKLIRQLNRLFGEDREPLREALLKVRHQSLKYQRIALDLRRQTGQAVRFGPCDVYDEFEEPDEVMFPRADASVYYEVVLNPGIRRGLDFDTKLLKHCGGTVRECEIWVSILFSLYAIYTNTMTHTPKLSQWEHAPYTPVSPKEKKIVAAVHTVMRDHGLSLVTRPTAKRKVPQAITYCCRKGEATIFDCLFTDLQPLWEGHIRSNLRSIPDSYPGVTVSWYERYDARGRVIDRYIWRDFPSGYTETVHLDEKDRILKVVVSRRIGKRREEVVLDVRKAIKKKQMKSR